MLGLLLLAWVLVSCAAPYPKFVGGLHKHQVPSCVKADLVLGAVIGTGAGAGTLHIVSATGGAPIAECFKLLQGGAVEQADLPMYMLDY